MSADKSVNQIWIDLENVRKDIDKVVNKRNYYYNEAKNNNKLHIETLSYNTYDKCRLLKSISSYSVYNSDDLNLVYKDNFLVRGKKCSLYFNWKSLSKKYLDNIKNPWKK